MKNIATKIIYYITIILLGGFTMLFFALYMGVRQTNPNAISFGAAFLIYLVIIGAVFGSVYGAIKFYKGGDIGKGRHDIENILGQYMQKWGLEYLGQLLLVLRGKTSKNYGLKISFIPLPIRVGIVGYRMLYAYQGVGLSTVVITAKEGSTKSDVKNLEGKILSLAKIYNGKVSVSGMKVVYMSKNKGIIDNNYHSKFFKDLAKIID